MKRALMLLLLGTGILTGCAPEVGSPEWCEAMEGKDKGEWTANDAADYARHCIFRERED